MTELTNSAWYSGQTIGCGVGSGGGPSSYGPWVSLIAVTNAYELWRNIWQRENPPAARPGMAGSIVRPKPKYTHRTFLEAVIRGLYAESDLLKFNITQAQTKKKKRKSADQAPPSDSPCTSTGGSGFKRKYLTNAFYVTCNRDIAEHGPHTFKLPAADARCQVCRKELETRTLATLHCEQCDIQLCVGHWNPWHKHGDSSKWIN